MWTLFEETPNCRAAFVATPTKALLSLAKSFQNPA